MKIRTLVIASLLCAGTVLAQAPAAPPAPPEVQAKQTPQYLDLRTPGSAVTARVTPQGITSPELQLDVSPTTLRGRAFGRPVDLTLKQDQNSITGMYGMSPVNLRLKNNGVAIQANGMFAGQLSNLKLSKEELSGTVGRCSYQLKAKDQQYEGSRSCGFGLENPVSVSIPPALAQSNEQVIAALSVLLAQ